MSNISDFFVGIIFNMEIINIVFSLLLYILIWPFNHIIFWMITLFKYQWVLVWRIEDLGNYEGVIEKEAENYECGSFKQ